MIHNITYDSSGKFSTEDLNEMWNNMSKLQRRQFTRKFADHVVIVNANVMARLNGIADCLYNFEVVAKPTNMTERGAYKFVISGLDPDRSDLKDADKTVESEIP